MTTHTIKVLAVPVAQPRQRTRVVASGGRQFAQNYTPQKHPVNVFKSAIQDAASRVLSEPFNGPVALSMEFVLPRPKSKTRKHGGNPREAHVSRPDVDNLAKAVLDSLKGIAWRDDAQVWRLTASKHVAAGEELPHVLVTIGDAVTTITDA